MSLKTLQYIIKYMYVLIALMTTTECQEIDSDNKGETSQRSK